MSYILEALKKSENERGHGSAPGVQTIHSSSINYHGEKRTLWPWLLAILVTINIGALVYFLVLSEPVNTAIVDVSAPEQAAAAKPATTVPLISPQPAAPIEQAPLPVVETEVQPDIDYSQGEDSTESRGYRTGIIDINELPANIRQYIPAMEFSAHVYSSNALQRSIVINGRFYEQGEQINEDLSLREITPDGAVFEFQGIRFSTSVLSGWN